MRLLTSPRDQGARKKATPNLMIYFKAAEFCMGFRILMILLLGLDHDYGVPTAAHELCWRGTGQEVRKPRDGPSTQAVRPELTKETRSGKSHSAIWNMKT